MINYQDGEREHYDKSVDSMRRFYSDIERKAGHYGDLLIAADKLIEGYVGASDDVVSSTLAASEVFPSEDAFNNISERELLERIVVFPLEDVGNLVETSGELVDIMDWYKFLVEKITVMTSKEHFNGCLISVGVGDGFRSCKSSMFCPWHYTTYQLRKDIIRPDFSRPAYQIGSPNITAAIAELKLNLSVEYGLTQPEHAKYLKDRYWDKHFKAIGVYESLF